MISLSAIQKTFIVLNICLLAGMAAFAQKQNVYFLKNNGKKVSIKDSADYIRIVSEPDSGTTLYNLKDYYLSGKAKLIGKTSRIEPVLLEGQCITYFPSGKRKELTSYKKGGRTGDAFEYYPNGKLYTLKRYNDTRKPLYDGINGEYTVLACNDSTGKALVVDGAGYYIGYDDDFKNIAEEGNLKAGMREGDWKGQEGKNRWKVTFTEKYENGKLLTGQSVDSAGTVVNYTKRMQQPEYAGGEQAFGRFLMTNIRYPRYARERNIQGRVYIKFVVEKDGSLVDMEVLKAANTDLADEGMRVMKLSPKWIAGMRYGRPVRVQFTVPINFSLGE
ncbi:TonB family protein [Mucilaginibacter sp. AW1-3]